MVKKNLICLLLGIITEIVKTLAIILYNGDNYEISVLGSILNVVAFTLLYSTARFAVNTIQSWHENGSIEKTCVICQFVSICMIICLIISKELNIILTCEIGISVICVVMAVIAAISLIMKKDKIIVFTSIKWIIILFLAQYTMFGAGAVAAA